MIRKIPPRRVPRDRITQRGGTSSGSIFGGSSIPGAHTHVEADITDLGSYLPLSGGTMTGQLNILGAANTNLNAEANVVTRIVLGEPTTLRGDAQDSSMRLYGEQASGITYAQIIYNGSNLAFTSTNAGTAAQFSTDLEVTAGGFLGVRDAGATDFGRWTHDGIDFNLVFTNTARYRITGLTAGLRLDSLLELTKTLGSSNQIVNFQQGYALYSDNTGAGTANHRLWFEAADQGEIVFGPRAGGDFLDQIRIRSRRVTFESDSTDGGAGTEEVQFAIPVEVTAGNSFRADGDCGFQGTAPISQPTVTGSRASNAALASLLTALANYGLIVDSSS